MRARTIRAVLVVGMAGVLVGSAGAAYVAGEAGNTQPYVPSRSPSVGGTIDFAVYDRSGGTAGDVFGTGIANFDSLFAAGLASAKLDTSAPYLYLFETVNNGPDSARFPIDVQGVFNAAASPTSFGSFAGTSFSTPVLGTPAGFTNPSPVETDGAPTILAGQTGLVSPGLTQHVEFLYVQFLLGLTSGQSSVLYGFTSNVPKFPLNVTFTGGDSSGADGGVVQPSVTVPEPGSLALVLMGVAGLLARAAWTGRRRCVA